LEDGVYLWSRVYGGMVVPDEDFAADGLTEDGGEALVEVGGAVEERDDD
jgi:hypothetical protein